MTPPRLIVLTGISAAGKTTVGRLLAESFERGAFVEGDQVREMVRTGRIDMTPEPGQQALDQLHLRYRQAAALADSFVAAGFTAVVEDVIIGDGLRDFLAAVRSPLVHLVVLAPETGAVDARERARAKTGYGGEWTVDVLDGMFRADTPRLGLWLDSSGQTPAETVREILDRLPESLLSDPPAVVRTERLLLRQVQDADLPTVVGIQCDPAANEFNTSLPTPAQAAELLAGWLREWAEHGIGYWAIVHAGTGETIGLGGLSVRRIAGEDGFNLYYRFRPSAWGHGYATEMARAALDWAARAAPDRPVLVVTVPENTAAKRVAAKLGMAHIGVTDEYVHKGEPVLALFRRPRPAPGELHTERLWLRRVRRSDLPVVQEIQGDPATNQYKVAPPSSAQVAGQLTEWLESWAEHGIGYWLVIVAETGEVVGIGGLEPHVLGGRPVLNLYYRFRPSAWGRGYAPEMATAAIEWAAGALPDRPVHVATATANDNAIRVAGKLGMARVGRTDEYAIKGLALYRKPLPEPEELHTERLWLHRLGPDELAGFSEIQSDPETNRFNREPATPAAVAELHQRIVEDWARDGISYWAVRLADTGELLGYGGLRHATVDGQPTLNLAYRFRPSAWGQGYAPEMARAAVDWARRARPDLPVSLVTSFDNAASIRVAEKLGFVLVGTTEHGDQGTSALYRDPAITTPEA
ncbi:GNAT family N-acetyltransferase [Crossiella sp. CA198]|uniref:GNAT family N-acetyltransferase n=1 Tax=Crossiella sp. CA198 TaxID=3455607 RepID=UPI003F8D61CF